MSDDVSGWQRYRELLQELSDNAAEQVRLGFGSMTQGWAIGTRGWRTAVAKDHAHLALSPGVSDDALQEIKAARWNEILALELAAAKKDADDVSRESKSCAWKIKVACVLRTEANAPYIWIAKSLNMGSPTSVRVYLSRAN